MGYLAILPHSCITSIELRGGYMAESRSEMAGVRVGDRVRTNQNRIGVVGQIDSNSGFLICCPDLQPEWMSLSAFHKLSVEGPAAMGVRVEIISQSGTSHEPARARIYEGSQLIAEVVGIVDFQSGADGNLYPCVKLEQVK
jgi:hypothetical protein